MKMRALAVFCLFVSGAASAASFDPSDYAQPHQRIDIGGRKLNLFCAGEGKPTVVFEAPLGSAGWTWFKVHGKVAEHTRACVYDRAGYGFSDPSGRAGDLVNIVDDLRALEKAGGLPSPYLLVANSYGAMAAQFYAYRFPSEVAGLVLVDGQSEDEHQLLDGVTGGMFSKMMAPTVARDEACAKQAEAGQVGDQCQGEGPVYKEPKLADALKKELSSPVYWRARGSEFSSYLDASSRELREARKSFGNMPLLVLTRTISPFLVPGQPQSDMNKAAEAAHRKSLDAIVALAPKGEIREVPDAAHFIQLDQPDAVSDAVIGMVKKLR